MIDFKDDGVLSLLTFTSVKNFDDFLSRQGAGGIQQVGSVRTITEFKDVVDGATYSMAFAGSGLRSEVVQMRVSSASAAKAVIDNVSDWGLSCI